MAVAFRSVSSTTYTSRTNTTVAAPAGLANNDILVLHIFVGASGTAPTVTPPSGFTAVTGSPKAISDGGFAANVYVFWKRASGESGSYTATHSAGSSQASLRAYSGCATSGSPIDASSANSGTGQITTATGITTTVADTMLLYAANNWEGSGTTPPSGFTERFDSIINDSDKAQASAGATGNVVQNPNGNINSSEPWTAFLIALKPPSGGTDTLLANDVESSSSVGTPAIGQKHALNANDIQSASSVSVPAIGQVHALAANDVESASSVSSPALSQIVALLANDIESGSEVSSPAIGQVHVLAGDDVESASSVGSPGLGQVHALNATDVESASQTSTATLGQVHALTADDVEANSEVSSPTLTEVAPGVDVLLADDIEAASSVSIPTLRLVADEQPVIIDYHDGVSRRSDWEVQAETAKKDRDALREIVERAFNEAMGVKRPSLPCLR